MAKEEIEVDNQQDVASEKATQRVDQLEALEKLQEMQKQESMRTSNELDQLIEELDKGNYFGQEYGKDSTVTIPGPLFSNLVNFANSQLKTHYSIESTLQILYNTNDAMITNLSKFLITLMKQHKTNVDMGVTITGEEMDKEQAEMNIKEVEVETPKKKKTKKATGSKA